MGLQLLCLVGMYQVRPLRITRQSWGQTTIYPIVNITAEIDLMGRKKNLYQGQ
jgi:hypothetical protein